MKVVLPWIALITVLSTSEVTAQVDPVRGGPIVLGTLDVNHAEIDAAHRASVARARSLGIDSAAVAPQATTTGSLGFPLRLRPHAKGHSSFTVSGFVDLDSSAGIQTYACTQRTYDGHKGIDFAPFPFWWRMMDEREVEIVAAAPGTIVNKQDGQDDRQCALNGAPANFVVVLQTDGQYAYYWHMQKGSVTSRPVGNAVARGEYLGMIGSSGNSGGPHLHFELRTANNGAGNTIDPYAGLCGAGKTRWKQQPKNADTAVVRLATHSAVPNPSPGRCLNPDPAYSNVFAPDDTVYAAAYLRDQRPDTPVLMSLIRPDGSVYGTWQTPTPPDVYPIAYWYVTVPQPSMSGYWRFRAEVDGKAHEHMFAVGKGARTTNVQASIQPYARALRTGRTGVFDVVVTNTGQRRAEGCTLSLDFPLAGHWSFTPLKPKGADTDMAFILNPGASKSFRLRFTPEQEHFADAVDVPVRVTCNNADGPSPIRGYNQLTVSFQKRAATDIIATLQPGPSYEPLSIAADGTPAVFQVSSLNKGKAGTVTVRPSRSTAFPIALSVCEFNRRCVGPKAPAITRSFNAGETVEWRVTAKAKGPIPQNLPLRRILIEFTDAAGKLIGATSVAVTTDAAATVSASR